MTPTIYLALTHDWELRADGSGDIEQIQFAPLRKLLEIYGGFGVRTTIFPDVLQQIAFRNNEINHPQLKAFADRWDQHVINAYESGHDVQLHVHTQWSQAFYEQGHWRLRGDWSLLNYPPEETRQLLKVTRDYLTSLLRRLDPAYQCLAFRAGALAVAPSPHLLATLSALGIVVDVSLACGLRVDTEKINLDYRNCEEDFLPFYPQMDDARRVSADAQPLFCVPLHSFHGSARGVRAHYIYLARRRLQQRMSTLVRSRQNGAQSKDTVQANSLWQEKHHSSLLNRVFDKGVRPCISGKYLVSDTARLSYALLSEMLDSIRQRALATKLPAVPVVITNHPKFILDFSSIQRFVKDAVESSDIRFITMTELANKLASGEFHVQKSGKESS
jgi:hypothetical protein